MPLRKPKTPPPLSKADRDLQLKIHTRTLVANSFNTFVRFGALVAIFYFGYRSVSALAGQATIADIGINNGLLLGPQLDTDGFDRLEVVTEIDGVDVGTGRPCDVLDGPLGSLRFLVGLHLDGVIRLEAGQWISAGAITGVHPIAPGQTATARFGGAVRIACTARPDPGFAR